METKEVLKDGSEVVIRPLTLDDLGRSIRFFHSLSAEDRKYLRGDVTREELVERRIRTAEEQGITRLVAVVDDEIVGDGALELSGEGWRAHLGEVRAIVAGGFQRKGLGMILLRDLYLLAVKKDVKKIVVKMAKPQIGARNICLKLGFHEEVVLPDYVQDQSGMLQGLIVMTCDTDALWERLEQAYTTSGWQRCR
ncbi:MAG: GNAT family N-acetyltransferase [Pseudomonadota bacterium]